ncbi:MAG: hypothetical protein A2W93_06280 [Bacteroidetes bacterium GWF2_43_63]|nr:MAG: hypothetical protein A2W94_08255 [Bacteroidetes bacterium GWE2_42_42]OFY53227.1 MAG: hypothetical protein A2W93_06280 [Bacteroidetes bacterium GWF2_43_63]HBG71781.1 DNA-binding protein [Bacteroidales bacterium]HCB61554.1 DNA-binding protein [Bacteroidales bacterium]HCY22766.1 DNA-binding protein [Bacteroidales bacterium]
METASISITAIPEIRLQQLEADIKLIRSAIFDNKKESFMAEWLESEQARKELGVCRKTWQNYRNKKALPFSQFGRKIYVRRSDLDAFMQGNIIK